MHSITVTLTEDNFVTQFVPTNKYIPFKEEYIISCIDL